MLNIQIYVYLQLHEKTDMDGDKYEISCGIDVLIGTPKRLSDMFSSAGYNVNKLICGLWMNWMK